MTEYTTSRVHCRNCRMWNEPQLPKLGERMRMRILMWVGTQLGIGVSSVSYYIENWRGPERDVTLGFSCRQRERVIQSQTHEIDSSCLRCTYTQKKRRKSKGNCFQFQMGMHAPKAGELKPLLIRNMCPLFILCMSLCICIQFVVPNPNS